MRKCRTAFVLLVVVVGSMGPSVGRTRQAAAEKPSPEGRAKAARAAPAHGKLIEMRHEDVINGVAFSPDGKVLASCSGGRDNSVRFWDPVTGKLLRRLVPRAGDGVSALAFAPDGKTLAIAYRSRGGILVYDTATHKEVFHLEMRYVADRLSLAFSPDGKSLAAGCGRAAVLWDLRGGKERHHIKDLGRNVQVAFGEGGRTLVTGDDSGKLRFWDTASGKLRRACDVPGDEGDHQRQVYGLAVSKDGRILIAGRCCCNRLWDLAAGKVLRRLSGNKGEFRYEPDASFAFAPDGKTVFSGGCDGSVRQWDVATGRELACYKGCGGWYQPVAVSSDGKRVAAGSQDHFVRVWDVRTGRQLAGPNRPPRKRSKPPVVHQHDGVVTALAFSPDGKRLASTGKDGQVLVTRFATGELVFESPEHWGSEYAVTWSADGKRLASADSYGVIRLWDAGSGSSPATLKGHEGMVAALSFCPGAPLLASGGYDGSVILWDPQKGKIIRRWRAYEGRVTSLAFSRDSKTLTTGGVSCTDVGGGTAIPMTHGDQIHVWDAQTGKELAAPRQQGDTLAVSSDGGILVAAGLFPDIKRDGKGVAINGKEIVTVSRSGVEVLRIVNRGSAVALSPDNQFLATAGSSLLHYNGLKGGNIIGTNGPDNDSSFRLWELATGKEVLRLPKLEESGLFVFAPDGRSLAYADRRGAVVILDLVRAAEPLSEKDPKLLWERLADKDAARAYRACCSLIQRGPDALPLLRERLRPVPAGERKRVKNLLVQLGDDRFEERKAASRALSQFGAAIEPAVREALDARPPLEVRRRLEVLLKEMTARGLTAEELRTLRAIRVLEQLGSPPARRLLRELSCGAAGFLRTEEAGRALQRLLQQDARTGND